MPNTSGRGPGAAPGRAQRAGRPSGGDLRWAQGLVRACHLGPTVVVTLLCAGLAAGVGRSVGATLVVTVAVLTGQLSIGWSNDWLDAGRDLEVGRPDKPVVQGLVTPEVLRVAATTAAGLSVVLSLVTGLVPGVLHVVVVAAGWLYNVRLKGTVWSWVPYAVAFGTLPAFVVLAQPGSPRPEVWVPVVGALLGVGAHLANVLPDLEDDRATGVRGLPHVLGRRLSGVLAPAALTAAALVAVLAPVGAPGPVRLVAGAVAAGLGVTAGAVGVLRPRSRLPFDLSMAVAAVCVVLLVTAGRGAVAG